MAQYRHAMIENKVFLADKMAKELSDNFSETTSSDHLPWHTCKVLQDLVEEIQADAEKYNITTFTAEIDIIRERAAGLLAKNRAYQAIVNLGKGISVAAGEFAFLRNYIAIKKLTHKEVANQFLKECQPYLEPAYHQLCFALTKTPFHLDDYHIIYSHANNITETYNVISTLERLQDIKKLTTKIEHYFIGYLERWRPSKKILQKTALSCLPLKRQSQS